MKIKVLVSIILIGLVLMSCKSKLPCAGENYKTDSDKFVASGNSQSANEQMCAEKALFDAQLRISKEINVFIDDNFNHPTVAPDPAYFTKLEKSKKSVLSKIEIECDKTKFKDELFYSYIAVSISKDVVLDHVRECLKQAIE